MIQRKKSIILVLAVLVAGASLVAWFAWPKSNKTISNNSFSFSYPKKLNVQVIPSTEGNYANYQIANPYVTSASRSTIMVSLPLKNTSIAFTLADSIKPYGNQSEIKNISLSGHQGQTITYRQDTNLPGDIPVHALITRQLFASKYATSPVMLEYFKSDGDASLNSAWSVIRNSLRY